MSSQSKDRGKGKAVSQSSAKVKKKVQFADKPSYLGESQPTASNAAQQAEDRAQQHHRQETVAGMADMGSSIRRTILAERAEGPFAHDGNPLPPVSPTKTVQYFNGKFQRVGSRSVEEAQRSAEGVERRTAVHEEDEVGDGGYGGFPGEGSSGQGLSFGAGALGVANVSFGGWTARTATT